MDERIYNPSEIDELINDARALLTEKAWGKLDYELKQRVQYYNFPVAFDIETTNYSFIDSDGKEAQAAFMYVWQLSFGGRVVMGRTWDEFNAVISHIKKRLLLDDMHRIVIYVHNLGFEFAFIHKYLNVKRVFAISSRAPITVETSDGLEFRCSYKLSMLSLDTVAKNLVEHDIRKLKGNLNYDLIRHSETPLTQEEIAYCVNDVQILIAYIEEEIKKNGGSIAKIPMTATGYARRYCREACLNPPVEGKATIEGRITNKDYRKLMQFLTLETEEYDMLKQAFQGGFTHANAWYYNDTLTNVSSFDFTSAYPANMCLEEYPISKGEFVEVSGLVELREMIKYYCVCFEINFTGLKRREECYDTYLSRPRARFLVREDKEAGYEYKEDNRKIVSCARCGYTITEQDLVIIDRNYTWDYVSIGKCVRYRKGYLPTELVKAILFLYQKKTELKNAWKTQSPDIAKVTLELYMHYKALLNSIYGMCVTDIIRLLYEYDADEKEWLEPESPNKSEAIETENGRKRRFLFYPWGVWTTAYARRNLWDTILSLGVDYVYSDTDSAKLLNVAAHKDYFDAYNANVRAKIKKAAKHHGIPESDFMPKTIKGEPKVLGEWDFEGTYDKFKTLGSKRYLTMFYDKDNSECVYELTCSGLNKSLALPYMFYHKHKDRDGNPVSWNVWKAFSDGIYIPPDYTGKLTHTYIDTEYSGTVIDYLGNAGKYHELSGCFLSGCDYTLSVEDDYKDFADYLIELARVP